MSPNQNTNILRLVRTILNILFGLLVVVSIFLALWIALSPIILDLTDITITSSVPVAIGEGDAPRMEVVVASPDTKGVRTAFVDEAQGTLRLETTDWYLNFVSNLAKLITAVGLAYLVYLLRAMVNAIQQGEVFTEENVNRMRRLGYLVLGVCLLRDTLEYFAAHEVFRVVDFTSPFFSLPSPFDPAIILARLLILALAQVWSYGLELERERALTI